MEKPNIKLYCSLLAVSCVFIIGCIFIPPECPWFGIISGLGCGGTTSVIVAWLIDYSNCKSAEKKMLMNRETILKNFFNYFESGCDSFIMLCLRKGALDELQEKLPWFVWVDKAYNCSKDDETESKIFCNIFRAYTGNILQQARVLEAQEAMLLDQGILGVDDVKALNGIVDICNLNEYQFLISYLDYSALSRNCYDYHKTLFAILHGAPTLKEINEKRVGSALFSQMANMGIDVDKYKKLA